MEGSKGALGEPNLEKRKNRLYSGRPIRSQAFISFIQSWPLQPPLDYQLAFVMPGMSPARAISRKQRRDRPN